ncbi:MAG: uroporphyrinogen decarboxylase family protein [Bryobacteraceae bacterium]
MTPRERWRALLAGEKPDRTPCDYWGTAEVTRRLLSDFQCHSEAELWKGLGVDKCIHLSPSHPRATEDTWHMQSLFSVWQIGTTLIPYADGLGVYEEAVVHPLADAQNVHDVERFPWPSADDWDYGGLRAACEQWPEYPILAGTSEPFYLYSRLRGMERALGDLIEEPAIADAILEHLFELDREVFERILSQVGDRIELVYVAEDLGTQESLLMSPKLFRRFLKPRMKCLIDVAHRHSVKVMHHDDGAIHPLIPDLIDAGIDILNPIQWRCRGMERESLAREFGQALVFHGGVDNQQTLPFATAEDVRRQVAENLRIFGQGKGYIVAPCHNIQPNTPTANIAALYRAVQELG